MGNPLKAIESLESLIQKDPHNSNKLQDLVALYEGIRNSKKLIGALEQQTKENPQDVQSLQSLIDGYHYDGIVNNHVDAIVRLLKMEKTPPSEADLTSIDNVSLAAALTEELKKRAEKREPDKPNPFLDELIRQLYMVRAFVIKKLRDGKLELFPDEETAVIRALEPYIRTGFLEEGKAFAAALDNTWNQGTRNRLHLVQLMRWNKQDPQALVLLSQLHEAYKDNLDILFEMARIATENGDVHTAIFVYEDIIKKDRGDVTNRIKLGDLYLEVGIVQKAFMIFEPIVSNMKNCDAMVGKLIQVAEYSEQRHMIISAAELADKLCPKNEGFIRKAAESLLAVGAEYKAIAFYSTYLRLNPDDVDAWRRLAELYSWTNKPKKAYGIYKKLMIQAKGNVEYGEKMIAMAASTGSPDIIQEAITLVSLLRPPDKTFKYKSAELLLAAGLEKEAISAYQQYLTLNPDDEAANQQLIRLYQWTDQLDKASDLLMQCSDKDPYNFEKALTAGNVLVEMGNIEDGVSYLKRASLIKPNHIKIRKQLVTYYGWLDRTDLIIEELEFLNSIGRLLEADRIFLAQTYLDRKKGHKALKPLKPF
jgi:tetratricopeptide (TPR) repeat protein